MFLAGSSATPVEDVEVQNNEMVGDNLGSAVLNQSISLLRTTNVEVAGNRIRESLSGSGVQIFSGNRKVRVEQNDVENQNGFGFFVTDVIGSISEPNVDIELERNKASDNDFNGILLRTTRGITVRNNQLVRNGFAGAQLFDDGITLQNSDNNLIRGNHSEENRGDGLHADSQSAGNQIRNNTLRGNALFDCRDDSAGPFPPGVANLWDHNNGLTESRPGLCQEKNR